MKEIDVIPTTLRALREMPEIKFNNKVRPCYAIFHDNINNIHKIFSHNTARQSNKYMYMNPGALKRGIRVFLEHEVYNITDSYVWNSTYGRKTYDRLSSEQVNEMMKYLFDNEIIEIVFPLENEEYQ